MLRKLRTLLERPTTRAAAHNLGWLVAEKAARFVLNVAVGFWVARYLGPARYGTLNYLLALVGMISLVAELGLDALVRRDLIRAPERTPALIATAWGLRLAGGAVAYTLALALAAAGVVGEGDRVLLAVVGLTLFQPALLIADLWFQAHLQAKLAVWAQMTAFAVAAAMRIGLILAHASLLGFAWAIVVELAVTAAMFWWLARTRGLAWKPRDFVPGLARQLLREAWPLLLSGFAVMLYLRLDVVMLRAMVSETAVGIYAAATRFTEMWFFVPGALASSALPALLRARERGAGDYDRRMQGYYDVSAGLAYAVALPLALAAPWVIRVAYGPAYAAAAPVLALHVWSSVFVFLGVARGQFLVNEGHTRFYLATTVAGLVVNAALNLVLIPRQGPIGAAVATLAAQAVAAWLSTFCFAPARPTAWMQTKALLIPVNWYRYVRRT